MSETKRVLTLDSNIFVGSAKADEPYRKRCLDLLKLIPESFILSEPSIVYEEVCGTVARRIGTPEAQEFGEKLDRLVHSELLFVCDRSFCLSSYSLCSEYRIYSIDALYLGTAIGSGAILVSLDDEDFISKLRNNRHNIEAYHVSDFPYF
ncbi:MAG: PIN domain-containing protein [archaeon]|nr:PIN domain-containing protein [archaeon]